MSFPDPTKMPHQVWVGDKPESEMFEDYLTARQYAIDHKLGTLDGRWFLRLPGVTIRSQREIAESGTSHGIEDIL